jgi:putative ABC transport system permease protein
MMTLINLLLPALLCTGMVVLSYFQDKKIFKDLTISILRMILQLTLLSLVLSWIFNLKDTKIVVSVLLIMTFNASYNIKSRIDFKYPGLFLDNLISLSLSIWPLCIIGSYSMYADKLLDAPSILPLMGMLLGNSLNGLSQGLNFFTKKIHESKDDVLSLIALGATTSEATKLLLQQSLRYGLAPNINAMISMGIVTIPGVMTGQLMAGMSPQEAVMIQIIIMLLVISGTYFGLIIGLHLSMRKYFNQRGEICF